MRLVAPGLATGSNINKQYCFWLFEMKILKRAGRIWKGLAGPTRQQTIATLDRASKRAVERMKLGSIPKAVHSRGEFNEVLRRLGMNYRETAEPLKDDYSRQMHRLALKQAIKVFCSSALQANQARHAFDKYYARSIEVQKSGKPFNPKDPKIIEASTEATAALGIAKVLPFTALYNYKYRAIMRKASREGARKKKALEGQE